MANELKLANPLVVGSFSSDPATGYNGEIYYSTSLNVFRVYQNGGWSTLSTGSVALTGQTLNAHNIIIGDNSTNLSDAVDTSSTGDVLADSSTALTIKSSSVSNAKLANMASDTLKGNNTGGSAAPSDLTVSQVNTMLGTELTANKGAANGYAPLDASAKVPYANLPSALMTFKGAWYVSATYASYTGTVAGTSTPITLTAVTAGTAGNSIDLMAYYDGSTSINTAISDWNTANPSNQVALTSGDGTQIPSNAASDPLSGGFASNSPTLADGTGTTGDTYRAASAGTLNLGSGSQTWAIGDFAIYNGTIWQHSPAADGVSSVNGASGAVTVNAINQLTGEVTAGPATQSQSEVATVTKDPAGAIINSGSGLKVKTDGSTIDINGSNEIEVKAAGITSTQLAAAAVLASNLGSVTDGVTLDQSGAGATLEVKSGGISNTQVNASAAIDYSKLAALSANRVPSSNASGFLVDNDSTDKELVSNSLRRSKTAGQFIHEEYIHSTTLTDNTSSPASVTAFQFAFATYCGEEITYVIETGAGTPDIRMGSLRVVSNGTTSSLVDTFTETADAGVSWTASISGSNILVNYTTTNQGTNRTMRADRKLFIK